MERKNLIGTALTVMGLSNRAASHRGIRLAPLLLVAVMLAAAFLVSNQPVQGQTPTVTLVSNKDQGVYKLFAGTPNERPDKIELDSGYQALGQVFTTGSATEYRLDSIDIWFATIHADSDPASELTVTLNTANRIRNSQAGNPYDVVVCTLTNPATFTSDAVNTFHVPYSAPYEGGDSCPYPYLEPDEDYAVVVTRANNTTDEISLYRAASGDEDTRTSPGWDILDGANAAAGPDRGSSVGTWLSTSGPLLVEIKGEIINTVVTDEVTDIWVEDYGWNSAHVHVRVASPGTVFIRWREKSETDFGEVWEEESSASGYTFFRATYPYMQGTRYVVQASHDESFSDPAQVEFTPQWDTVIRDIKVVGITRTTATVEVTVVPSDQPQEIVVWTGRAITPRNWVGPKLVIPANTSSATKLLEGLEVGTEYLLLSCHQVTPDHCMFFGREPWDASFTTLPAPVTLTPTSLNIDEGGSDEYTVVLDLQPTSDVTINISADSTEGEVTTDLTSLTFTTSNWHTPQAVTVNANHDNDDVDDAVTITHMVTVTEGSAAEYGTSTVLDEVSVTVLDDEGPTPVSSVTMTSNPIDYGNTQNTLLQRRAHPGNRDLRESRRHHRQPTAHNAHRLHR